MKLALVESATEILVKVKGSQLDWFRESLAHALNQEILCIQSGLAVVMGLR